MKYSIVVPAYNSGPWIDELVQRIGAVMNQYASEDFELILVNDCSPDGVTWPAIVRNAAENDWVRGIDLLYNVHQFRATICGLEHASGDLVITMDDDLQHPPEEIPKLLAAIEEDKDILCVMGTFETKKHNVLKNLGSKLYQNIMNRLYGKPADIKTSSFRVMRQELAQAIVKYRTMNPQMGPLTVALTKKLKNVAVRHAPRDRGSSGYSLVHMISTTLQSIVNASTAPLRLFSIIGLLSAGASMLIGLSYLIRWMAGGIGVAGYTSQILLIIFFGGMSLAGIGLLGEYVARIISEISGPQRYQVKDYTNLEPMAGEGQK